MGFFCAGGAVASAETLGTTGGAGGAILGADAGRESGVGADGACGAPQELQNRSLAAIGAPQDAQKRRADFTDSLARAPQEVQKSWPSASKAPQVQVIGMQVYCLERPPS